MLEQSGYRVDVVGNGAEAINAVAQCRYDAVLMDCRMPGRDAYQATREIHLLRVLERWTAVAWTSGSAAGPRGHPLAG